MDIYRVRHKEFPITLYAHKLGTTVPIELVLFPQYKLKYQGSFGGIAMSLSQIKAC